MVCMWKVGVGAEGEAGRKTVLDSSKSGKLPDSFMAMARNEKG